MITTIIFLTASITFIAFLGASGWRLNTLRDRDARRIAGRG